MVDVTMSKSKDVLDFYESLVDGLIEARAPHVLDFEGLGFSGIVTSKLISMANKRVDIFHKNLAQAIWLNKDVSFSLSSALRRGVSFNILAEEKFPKYIESVFSHYKVPVVYVECDIQAGNFIVSDDRAYALFKPAGHSGFACFNDGIISFKLSENVRAACK
ncbi:MAG: hypothetical protein WCI72_05435 [archaeon]